MNESNKSEVAITSGGKNRRPAAHGSVFKTFFREIRYKDGGNNFNFACGVSKLILILIIFTLPASFADNPAPYSKQLNLGVVAYYSGCNTGEIWTNVALRNFYANHYSWSAVQTGGITPDSARYVIETMRAINPNLIVAYYDLYLRLVAETTSVQTWMRNNGITDSIYIRAANAVEDDSIVVRMTPFNPYSNTQSGEIMVNNYFGADRFAWDYRYEDVANYLYYRYKSVMTLFGANGIFIDEFACTRCSDLPPWGDVLMMPFTDATTIPGSVDPGIWAHGSPFDINNPWNSNLSPCEIRDSLAVLNATGWGKVLGDSFSANNQVVVVNPASWGSPYAATTFWDNEYRHFLSSSRLGIVAGEYANYRPSQDGWEINCNNMAYACSTVADSGLEVWVWPIVVGQEDSSAVDGFTIARSRMNALGMMLDCLFPGSTTFRFGPHPGFGGGVCGLNAFVGLRTHNGITLSDTTTDWDAAWGKYFGEPTFERTESLTGIDGAGQSYTIHEIKLNKPTGGVLTLAVGRFCRGSNRRISNTQVDYSLPTGTWYELNSGGTWQQAGPNVGIANAHWRFFSSDTSLSNDGPGTVPGDSLNPGKPTGVSTEPAGHGSFSVTWIAPADDGYDPSSGSVNHYEIRYSTDSVQVVNWNSAQIFPNPPWPPSAPGQQEFCVLNNLMPGEIYYFGIKAIDEANNASVMSDIDSSFAGGIKPPAPDTIITIPDQYSANAYCTPVSSYLPISYQFAYDTSVFFQTQQIRFPLVIDTLVQTTFDSLLAETVYYWRCRSIAYGQDSSVWANGVPFTLEGGTIANTAPLITSSETAVAVSDSMFCYTVTVNDPDGPALMIFFENTPSWLNLPRASSICGIPPAGAADTSFMVIAFDGILADTLIVSVTVQRAGGPESGEELIHPYPNPFRASEGHTFITFTELPGNSKISISTVSGQIVRTVSDIGSSDWVWDVKNDKGRNLASGVYLYFVEYPGGHFRGKLMIIR